MLATPELQRIARAIVNKRLPAIAVDDVTAESMTSSDGEAALRITLVLAPEAADAISGDEAVKLLVDIRDSLAREGEERFPIVEYATADDVPGDDDQDD